MDINSRVKEAKEKSPYFYSQWYKAAQKEMTLTARASLDDGRLDDDSMAELYFARAMAKVCFDRCFGIS